MKRPTNIITESTSKKYVIGLSTMAAALLFFLFSGFVFGNQDRAEVQQTPLHEPLHVRGAGELIIEEWTYNSDENLMVVTLNLDQSTTLLNDQLIFTAQEKENPQRELPTRIEYHDEYRYVISIQEISSSFDVIALDIAKDKRSEHSYVQDEQSTFKGGDEREELARVYTDQRKVKTDQTLSLQTEQEYEVGAVSQEIKEAKKSIKDKKEQILTIDERLKEMDQKIVELESERLFETDEEKERTTARIEKLENEKDRLLREATENETMIQTIKEKLTMLEEKREMIAN
ncbi:hypothetical protein [Halobacillus seohaensis]|uniref:Uncharacterized protein n=1 Tax=Halobacillus seohaensis TaxID=447421 RepID=A0ABW2EJZ1_9BACI